MNWKITAAPAFIHLRWGVRVGKCERGRGADRERTRQRADRQADRKRDRETERETDRQIDRQTSRQTDRQTERETEADKARQRDGRGTQPRFEPAASASHRVWL